MTKFKDSMLPKNGVTTPEIRFKGFKGDWPETKLKDIVEIYSGRDYKHLSPGHIPVYGTGGYMLSVDKALSYCKDAIGIGRKGTIDKPYLLRCPFWTVDTLFYAIPGEGYNLDFTYSIFQKIDWKTKDESTGVPSLSKNAINEIQTFIPLSKEQQKIGTYFKELNRMIELHQLKHKKLLTLKQAMLQKMFPRDGATTPEIRFKGSSEDWIKRPFNLITSRVTQFCCEKGLPRLEYEDIISNSGQLNKNLSEKKSNKKGIKFEKEDVLFGKLRPYLKNWLLATFDGIAVGDFWVLRPSETVPSFLYQLIQTEQFEVIANQSAGSKMPRSDWSLVSNYLFYIPASLVEQQKIGTYFRKLDELITQHATQLEKLKQIKSACLNKMFV